MWLIADQAIMWSELEWTGTDECMSLWWLFSIFYRVAFRAGVCRMAKERSKDKFFLWSFTNSNDTVEH